MSERRPQDVPSVDDYEFYLAEDMKKREARKPPPSQAPQDVPTRPRSLAERAAKAPKKKMTALEAVAAAEREAQAQKEREKKAELARKLAVEAAQRVAKQKAEAEKLRAEEEEREAREAAEWARKAFASTSGPKEVAGRRAMPKPAGPVSRKRPKLPPPPGLPEGAVALVNYDTIPARSMLALMKSHQSRATNQGDMMLSVALGNLVHALEHDADNVGAMRVAFADDEWAVWTHHDQLLGAFTPADLFLIGM